MGFLRVNRPCPYFAYKDIILGSLGLINCRYFYDFYHFLWLILIYDKLHISKSFYYNYYYVDYINCVTKLYTDMIYTNKGEGPTPKWFFAIGHCKCIICGKIGQ